MNQKTSENRKGVSSLEAEAEVITTGQGFCRGDSGEDKALRLDDGAVVRMVQELE